jgi:hypothetical protein
MAKSADNSPEASTPKDMAAVVARARWLMLISAVTTAVAIAAVVGVIGYRFYSSRGGAATITNGTVFLPQGARVLSTTVSGGRIVVTLDLGGASEVRIYDLKTLQQTGRLHFATEQQH